MVVSRPQWVFCQDLVAILAHSLPLNLCHVGLCADSAK